MLLGQLAAVRSELERISFRESPSAAGTNATSNLSSTFEDDDDDGDDIDDGDDDDDGNTKEKGNEAAPSEEREQKGGAVRPREVSSTLWWDEEKGATWLRERQVKRERERARMPCGRIDEQSFEVYFIVALLSSSSSYFSFTVRTVLKYDNVYVRCLLVTGRRIARDLVRSGTAA